MRKLSIAVVALAALCGVAGADNKDKADALFKQGKKLMGEKRYADACQAFEQSYKLDPGIGAQLNIAKCYEEWGKIGRAYLAYKQAEKLARDAKDSREDKIRGLIEELDAQVPRLTLRVPKDTDIATLRITIDGRKFDLENLGEPQVIDPGPHTIEFWVTGGEKQKKSKIVPVERGGDSEVTLDVPAAPVPGETPVEPEPEKPKVDPIEQPVPPGRNQRLGGIVLGGAGVIAIGVSSIMTLSARGQYNDALDTHCMGMKNACDPMGLELTADARSTANTATVIFLVGTAAVGGGVALYLLAPKTGKREGEQAVYVVPSVSPAGAGLVVGGRY